MTYMLQGGLTSKPSEVPSKVFGKSTHRRRGWNGSYGAKMAGPRLLNTSLCF